MGDAQVMRFTSQIAGRQAAVRVLPSRVEWTLHGHQHVTRMLPMPGISSVVTKRAGIGKSMVTVESLGTSTEFHVAKTTAEAFTTTLAHLLTQQQTAPLNVAHPPAPGSIADELTGIEWLLEVGVLSEPEFEDQRARLLGL